MSDEAVSDEEHVDATPAKRVPPWIGAGLVAVVTVLAVGAAFVIGTNRAPDASASPASPVSTDSGVVVSGTGTATGVPDQLRFTVTVRHNAADVAQAMDATSADTRAVVRALTAQGVAKTDVRTAGVSVEPTYRYSGGQEQITGYAASERVAVKVRDIKVAGKVIAAAATAAGNAVRIGGIAMSVADPSAIEAAARDQAFAEARTKAAQFAKAAGRTLGEVVTVEESQPTADYSAARGALDSVDLSATVGKVPIDPGTETTKVYVTVRWSFT